MLGKVLVQQWESPM